MDIMIEAQAKADICEVSTQYESDTQASSLSSQLAIDEFTIHDISPKLTYE